MAIDPTVTMVTVEGQYFDFQGDPIVGQVKFALTDMLRNSIANQMIVPSVITVTLDEDGHFTTSLPSTNDPDLIPEFVYHVEESFPFGRSYTMVLPYTTVGTVHMADLSPVPSTPDPYYSMVLEVPWEELVANIDALDVIVNQTTDTITESGEYAFMNASEASYTALNAAFATYTLLNTGPYVITPSELEYFSDRAATAATTAAGYASTATALTGGMLNPLLLIGG